MYSELAFPSLFILSATCPAHPNTLYTKIQNPTLSQTAVRGRTFLSPQGWMIFHFILLWPRIMVGLCSAITLQAGSGKEKKKKQKQAGSEPEGLLGILHKDC